MMFKFCHRKIYYIVCNVLQQVLQDIQNNNSSTKIGKKSRKKCSGYEWDHLEGNFFAFPSILDGNKTDEHGLSRYSIIHEISSCIHTKLKYYKTDIAVCP